MIWNIKPEDTEEAIMDDVVLSEPIPTGPRYKIIKEVTHNDVRYPPDTLLPIDLIRPDGIDWLLKKGAIEISEE